MIVTLANQIKMWKYAKHEYEHAAHACLFYADTIDYINDGIQNLRAQKTASKEPGCIAYIQAEIEARQKYISINARLFNEAYQDFLMWEELGSMPLLKYLKEWLL